MTIFDFEISLSRIKFAPNLTNQNQIQIHFKLYKFPPLFLSEKIGKRCKFSMPEEKWKNLCETTPLLILMTNEAGELLAAGRIDLPFSLEKIFNLLLQFLIL